MINFFIKNPRLQSVIIVLLILPLFYFASKIHFNYLGYISLFLFLNPILFVAEIKHVLGKNRIIPVQEINWKEILSHFVLVSFLFLKKVDFNFSSTTQAQVLFFLKQNSMFILYGILVILIFLLQKRNHYLIVRKDAIQKRRFDEFFSKKTIKWRDIKEKYIKENILNIKSGNRAIKIDLTKISQEDKQFLLEKLKIK